MQMFARAVFFAVLLTGVFVASAEADTVYTYVGSTINFVTGVYQKGDQVTGTFTLSSSFVPAMLPGTNYIDPFQYLQNAIVSYSFTDGHQTLTQSNSIGSFQFGFNQDGTPAQPGNSSSPFGDINQWDVILKNNMGTSLISVYLGTDFATVAGLGCSNFSDSNCTSVAIINGGVAPPEMDGTSGTWTIDIPEGGSTVLFLFVGLAGLTILSRFSGLKRVTRRL
jgi:hypothetical protein